MILWLDAQLSPAIAAWIRSTFGIEVHAVRDLGLRDSTDVAIFQAAKQAGAVVATKDSDFVELVERLGSPPQVVWITCGNTSNARLKEILTSGFPAAKALLDKGEPLVEITDSP
jgi:predicted nuclease of predicted toxin-antitoxin system